MALEKNNELDGLLQKIPKSDLHCHLDGSLRPETLLEIADKEKLTLPVNTVDELNKRVFKDQYNDLVEYLKTFEFSCAVMQKPEYLERIAYELAVDVQKQGLRYIEARFAPQLHINANQDMETVLCSIHSGLLRAKNEFNHQSVIKNKEEPPFDYGMIVCALRTFGKYSDYYTNLINAHPFSDQKTISQMASLELVRGAVEIRDRLGLPIVGFDLAGAEAGHPARDHRDAFQYAHSNFLAKTVHAGEAYGATSIFQAITECHADRIGHGFYLFDESRVADNIADKKGYIDALAAYIASRRITIEVCLTSNLQTNADLAKISEHTFGQMLKHGLSVTLCTDNQTVSKTSVSREIRLALENFNISPEQLKNIIVYGFKRSFFPGSYTNKREYVRQCIDYYEKITKGTALDPAAG